MFVAVPARHRRVVDRLACRLVVVLAARHAVRPARRRFRSSKVAAVGVLEAAPPCLNVTQLRQQPLANKHTYVTRAVTALSPFVTASTLPNETYFRT